MYARFTINRSQCVIPHILEVAADVSDLCEATHSHVASNALVSALGVVLAATARGCSSPICICDGSIGPNGMF